MDFRNFPSILLALTVTKRCQSPKSTNKFQRYGKYTQMTPEVFFFFLNLSKKVKSHLFCTNLDTGYLLYVIVWIPKAFCLLSHHSRVVFTISNVFFWTDTIILFFLLCSIWIYFKIKTSLLILTFLPPTHRCIVALREKIINLPLLEVKI